MKLFCMDLEGPSWSVLSLWFQLWKNMVYRLYLFARGIQLRALLILEVCRVRYCLNSKLLLVSTVEIFMTMFSWSHNRVISKIGYLWYLWYWNRPLILILTSMCAVWSAESSGKVGHVRHWWWGVPPFSPGSCTLPASLAPAASWPYT